MFSNTPWGGDVKGKPTHYFLIGIEGTVHISTGKICMPIPPLKESGEGHGLFPQKCFLLGIERNVQICTEVMFAIHHSP